MNHPEYQQDLFPYWTKVPIRFRDLDPLSHVNNAIFSTYYEEARISFINRIPEISKSWNEGFSFVLANINIDFIHPAKYPANLLIGSGITNIGNTSISSFQSIYSADNKELISVAEAHGVWFDMKKKKPASVPEIEGRQKFMMKSE